jgi:hypothetical protein
MRTRALLRAAAASTMMIAFSVAAQAQSEPQKVTKSARTKQKPATLTKTHRVWTEDDISTVRTQADKVIDASDRQRQGATEAAAAHEASEKQDVRDPAKPPAKKPPLSQAKSAEDADAKIGWEKRDIQGQEEYIAGLEQRLPSATPEERAHLQQLIATHKQYIVESQKEMQGLEEQKRNFQKPSAAHAPVSDAPASDAATSAESQPPSQ